MQRFSLAGVAIATLTAGFGTEKSREEIRAVAKENYIRLAENYLCLLKVGGMSDPEIAPYMEWAGMEKLHRTDGRAGVLVTAHFGNFELFTRLPANLPAGLPPQKFATTWLALLADPHAGDRGLWLPFLGRDCSCSASPAVLALRSRHPLITAICYRTGPAWWRWEFGDWISDTENGRRRSVESVTREINALFESAIRRDPANWFWVHRRWKPPSPHQRPGGTPASRGEDATEHPTDDTSPSTHLFPS